MNHEWQVITSMYITYVCLVFPLVSPKPYDLWYDHETLYTHSKTLHIEEIYGKKWEIWKINQDAWFLSEIFLLGVVFRYLVDQRKSISIGCCCFFPTYSFQGHYLQKWNWIILRMICHYGCRAQEMWLVCVLLAYALLCFMLEKKEKSMLGKSLGEICRGERAKKLKQ